MGAKPQASFPEEKITKGMVRGRLTEYKQLGARFAKWRAVIAIGPEQLPAAGYLDPNMHALAR